jgi:uncharacterized protein with HEPN domain
VNLIIIGEVVAKRMDGHGEFIQRHNQIPWRSTRGMQNRIAYGYFDINLDVVWETVQLALPKLIVQLDAVRCAPGADDRNGQESARFGT